MRWVVFDDETSELIMGKYKRGAAEVHYRQHPLDAALKAGRSLLLLPAADPGKVLVAKIEVNSTKPAFKSRQPVVAQFTPLRSVAKQPPPTHLHPLQDHPD